MTDLVERVARAISGATLDWGDEEPEAWDSHRYAALAALAMIREALHDIPPEAVRAMAMAFANGAHPVRDAARALADVMLKEEGNG